MARSTIFNELNISLVSSAVTRDRNIEFIIGSLMNWSGDIFWLGIFLAKFGPMLTKNSLNVLQISVPSEIIVPSVILNLFGIFFVLFLLMIFFIICHFLCCPYLSPRGRNDISFQHILEYDSICFCKICKYFHYLQSLILSNFHRVYFSFLLHLSVPGLTIILREWYCSFTFCFGKCLLKIFSKTLWNWLKAFSV